MKIYNSLTRSKQEFTPLNPPLVSMYVCGPTVYGPPHVGHARSYVNFDIVNRELKHLGYRVKYVQNITDVGHLVGDSDDGQDKIIAQSIKENVDPYEIAYKYECDYFDKMDKLNILRPNISIRATGCIMDMIEFVQEIINKGYGYVTDKGNVYFDVKKFKDYGKLSNRKLDESKSGTRVEIASDKHNNEDFALWKKAEGGHIMKWSSPWGEGYPGWHLECSTMSRKFLGKTIDIHGGGIDNMFPHHESEIAQSECANGCEYVKYFMHNNLITVNGVKMGKSLGNFITLKDLFEKYDPLAVRYFILSFHYRAPVDFSEEGLKLAQEQYYIITETVNKVRSIVSEEVEPSLYIKDLYDEFENAMQDDFNTAIAISIVLKVIKQANKDIINKNIENLKMINYIINHQLIEVLGFKFTEESIREAIEIPKNIIELAEKRIQAKKDKNFNLADEIRNEITNQGYQVIDSRDGYEIKKI